MTMLEQAQPGKDGPEVGRPGYGAKALDGFYGAAGESAAPAIPCQPIEAGTTTDSADACDAGHGETIDLRDALYPGPAHPSHKPLASRRARVRPNSCSR